MITYKRKRYREVPLVRNAIKEGPHQEDQHRETQSMGFRLMDLPDSVIIEILKKLATEEVLQCRLEGDVDEGDVIGRADKTLEHVSMRQIPQRDNLIVVGSSKGFICLWNKSLNANTLYVTNPLLGESVVLPKPLGDKYSAIDETYWFGYIPTMGIFKAFRVKVRKALLQSEPRQYIKKSEVHVLVIGTDKWKCAGDAPFPCQEKFCKTILNGCLHWIVGDDEGSLQLHSFNMEKDQALSFPPPPKLRSTCSLVELGVVRNRLGLFGCSSDFQYVEIWFMKKYGVVSSWTKFTPTRLFTDPSLCPVRFEKVEVLKFIWYFGLLLSYDPKEKMYTGSFNLGSERNDDVWIYTPSFLSLTGLCLGARLRVKGTKSYYSKLSG